MRALNQLLYVFQRATAAVFMAIGYWLFFLYATVNHMIFGEEVFQVGVPTMIAGNFSVLNWMGIVDSLLPVKAEKRRGILFRCLRVVLYVCGGVALLTLSWCVFGYYTGIYISAKNLILISCLQLVYLVPLHRYIQAGAWPMRQRKGFIKDWQQ